MDDNRASHPASPTPHNSMSPAIELASEVEKKKPKPEWRIPLLRLRVNDVSSEGSAAFFEHINATTLLREAVVGVLEGLYTPETVPSRSVEFTLAVVVVC